MQARMPNHNSRVHKEECTQCFKSAKDQGGIYVCLQCFNGGCLQHAIQHAKTHQGHNGHLNIRKIEIPSENNGEAVSDEPPQKVTKLAIGVEGGAEGAAPRKKYREETNVLLLPDGVPVEVEGHVADVVAALLASADSAAVDEAAAWEKRVTECEHTLTLQQATDAPQLKAKGLAHCKSCDLNRNLWLCLTCGSLGCGRKQYGAAASLGGNAHALAHNAEHPDHPLVVKMATITPEGKGDIYCYACDNEVSDAALGAHLAHFGIDIATQEKTEKSITELELEQNADLQLNGGETDATLVPAYGPGLTGLINIGNTCYMNSALQMFFSFPEWQQHYVSGSHDVHMPHCSAADPSRCWSCQTGKLAHGILSGENSVEPAEGDDRKGIAPRMWKSAVTRNSEFQGVDQQDVAEFVQFLVRKTKEFERAAGGADPTQLFSFDLCERLECTSCGKCRYSWVKDSTDLQMGIPVHMAQPPVAPSAEKEPNEERRQRQMKSAVTWEDCMKHWAAPRALPDWKCSGCGNVGGGKNETRFARLPTVLTVQMGRFEYTSWVSQKVSVRVEGLRGSPPPIVDFAPLVATAPAEGEQLLEDAEESASGPVPDEAIVAQLQAMGFPLIQCQRSALAVGNAGIEAASEYLFSHMDDPALSAPLPTAGAGGGGASKGVQVNPESVQMLQGMGFTEAQASHALRETGGNMERAVDWLFSHPEAGQEAPAAAEPEKPQQMELEKGPTGFQLWGFILHKGNTLGSGHYVAYLWSAPKNSWIVFDDERVSLATNVDAAVAQAYMYFFRKVE